jgi:hypothetical protein
MGWLSRLKKGHSEIGLDSHDAPDFEITLPMRVAGRDLARWSVAGESFWKAVGGDRARSALAPELASVGLSPADISMAVAGRADTSHPPYIIWGLRFGDLQGDALRGPVPSSLAMDVMHVDANQGETWSDATLGGKKVLVGNEQMVHQDAHHRGKPYVHIGTGSIYAVIADDEAWAREAIEALPPD